MSFRFSGLLLAVLISAAVPARGQSRAGDGDSAEYVLGEGYAGVYPDILRGRITASGAVYEPHEMIASHRYLPLGSVVRVVNDDSGESVDVRIVDRGPYTGGRVMDLSEAAARRIGLRDGHERYVRIVRAVEAGVAGSTGERVWSRSQRRGGFTIQLGSYSSEPAAEAARGRAEGAWVQAVEVDGQTFFRLNFGRYESREQAAEDLEQLEGRGFFGFVKSLSEGV